MTEAPGDATAARKRAPAAEAHLEVVRGRVKALDAERRALADERDGLEGRIGLAALDAIEDPKKAPALAKLRARLAAIPGAIEATDRELGRATKRDLPEAEAALQVARLHDAAVTATVKAVERERLAGEVDGLLERLAERWRAFAAAGDELSGAMRTLGLASPLEETHDTVDLARAVKRAGPELALALGCRPDRKTVGSSDYHEAQKVGWARQVETTEGWPYLPSLASSTSARGALGRLEELAAGADAAAAPAEAEVA